MSEDTETQNEVGRRRFLQTGAVAAALGVAGCMGGDEDEELPPPPTDTETETATTAPTETGTPEPKFSPLSFEQIVEKTFVPEDKWLFGPYRAEEYKDRFEDTSLLITETIRETRESERNNPNNDLSDNEMMPHYRTYIHGKEFLNFSHDEITIGYRENEVGTAIMRVWDHTGGDTQRYLISPEGFDKDGRDTMILREGEEPDLSSTTQAGLASYRDGENNTTADSPFEVEDFRTSPSESELTQEERIESALGMGRSQVEFYQEVFDYTEFEGPEGEIIDASEVDITFGWHTGEYTVKLEKSEEFFTTGTEYVHNIAALSDTQNMLIGVDEDFNEYNGDNYSSDNLQPITEIDGKEILATTVTDELYKQARDELFMSAEDRKAYN